MLQNTSTFKHLTAGTLLLLSGLSKECQYSQLSGVRQRASPIFTASCMVNCLLAFLLHNLSCYYYFSLTLVFNCTHQLCVIDCSITNPFLRSLSKPSNNLKQILTDVFIETSYSNVVTLSCNRQYSPSKENCNFKILFGNFGF